MAQERKLPKWHEIPIALVAQPTTSVEYKTGSWRTRTPVTDEEKCIKCGVCWLFCPDNSRYQTKKGHYDSNLDYCKGCGICSRECPTGCIIMIEREE